MTADKMIGNSVSIFVDMVKHLCEENGVKCHFPETRFVPYPDGREVNGYFDEENKLLVAACGQPQDQWLPLMLHEFCHFIQWKENDPEWTASWDHPFVEKFGVSDGYTAHGEWLDGKEFSDEAVDVWTQIVRDLELGCERKAYSLINVWNLPIDREDYARRGSAYVYFYNVVRKYRKWYVIGNEPYNCPDVLELMPTNLDGDYSTTPEHIEKVMVERCLS
jgi:hypothetical protein